MFLLQILEGNLKSLFPNLYNYFSCLISDYVRFQVSLSLEVRLIQFGQLASRAAGDISQSIVKLISQIHTGLGTLPTADYCRRPTVDYHHSTQTRENNPYHTLIKLTTTAFRSDGEQNYGFGYANDSGFCTKDIRVRKKACEVSVGITIDTWRSVKF